MTDKKHRKSLTMSDKLFTDLNDLCDVLGVNSHSYILNIVAREVNKDLIGIGFRNSPNVKDLPEDIQEEIISQYYGNSDEK